MKSTFKNILCLLILSSPFFPSFTQSLLVMGGSGYIDLLNAGIKFEYRQMQAGLTVGTAWIDRKVSYTSSVDLFYHFAGKTKGVEIRPWYFRNGLHLFSNEDGASINKIWFLKTRVGKDINLTDAFGLFIEAGTMFRVWQSYTDKDPADEKEAKVTFPACQPGFGGGIFYRF